MNFFQHQEGARRQTHKLIGYFIFAVLLIVLVVNGVVGLVVLMVTEQPNNTLYQWIEQPWWCVVSVITLLVIVGGSIRRVHQLREGGDAIAEWAGAKRLDMYSRRQQDKVFINVAEEMAIASGMPLPSLWVMEREGGINAFVAGMRPSEAALVVTRGCLEQLDRDELQGVIGHEFSHIFHGDMRLNIWLMGVLAGILAIGQMGGLMLRSTGAGISYRRNAKTLGVVLVTGIALLLVGAVGLFFGRLIKASVSRQREYLADAAAVQYTRNTHGIAGALVKIRDTHYGSHLIGARAEEMSHMCFGATLSARFGKRLATHPPLDKRIQRIDPYFMVKARSRARARQLQENSEKVPNDTLTTSRGFAALSQDVVSIHARDVVESIGNPGTGHIAYAQALHAAIPVQFSLALHEKMGAKWLVMAMLLGSKQPHIDKRKQIISLSEGVATADSVVELHTLAQAQWPRLRLAVVDLALPQLKMLCFDERKQFMRTVGDLVVADGKTSLFEFTLLAILRRHLPFSPVVETRHTFFTYKPVEQEIALLLSLMIRVGGDSDDANTRYTQLLRTFTRNVINRQSLPTLGSKTLNVVLGKLQNLAPILKASVIESLIECVLHNGHIKIQEAELLRAVAEMLDCPLPPLIDTHQNTGQLI